WRFSLHCVLFLFNYTTTTEIYTLSLHDALPIYSSPSQLCSKKVSAGSQELGGSTSSEVRRSATCRSSSDWSERATLRADSVRAGDRKSTRLNSSHVAISYAVFCLKKKKILPLTS